MIDSHDILAITACVFPGLALVALTVIYIWRTEKRKTTIEQLRTEIVSLRRENMRLNELVQSGAAEENIPAESAPQSTTPARMSVRESLLMNSLHETVMKNYSNPEFGVDELADALGISRSSLNRRLRDTLDTTANNFIRDIRIQKAEELLRNSSLQINEICYRVGFQTPSYFIKCFRKKYGQSPNEYANSYNSPDFHPATR